MTGLAIWIVIVIGALILAGWVGLRFLLYKAFHHPPIRSEKKPQDFGLKVEEYFLETNNKKKIQAFFIDGDERKPIIIGIHGWENTVERLFPLASFLSKKGYPGLLVNARNHGETDKDSYSTMVKYSQDLDSGIKFIVEKLGPKRKIILLGHSLGAATSLYKAARDERIQGVISVASFSNIERLMRRSLLARRFPLWLVLLIIKYIERSIGEKLVNLSPATNVVRIQKPILLLHGSRDTVVPVSDFEELKKLARSKSLQWKLIENCDHSSLLFSEETFKVIENFLGLF